MPIWLPLALVCAGYAASRLATSSARPRWLATAMLVAAIAAQSATIDLTTLGHVELRGSRAATDQLTALLPPDAVALFPLTAEAHAYQAPLQYLAGRTTVLVGEAEAGDARWSTLVRWWQTAGRPVYWVATTTTPTLGGGDLSFRWVGRTSAAQPVSALSRTYPPGQLGWTTQVLDVYAVVAGAPAQRTVASADLLAPTATGWHAPDGPPGAARWTTGSARLPLPRASGDRLYLQLTASGERPFEVAPPTLTLSVNGRTLGATLLTPGQRTYLFPLPPDLPADQDWWLETEVPVWRPADTGTSADARALGVLVQSVAIVTGY